MITVNLKSGRQLNATFIEVLGHQYAIYRTKERESSNQPWTTRLNANIPVIINHDAVNSFKYEFVI